MDTYLINGDHAKDSRGMPCAASAEQELLQRAMISLAVKKGSFKYNPNLGSELYRLRQCPAGTLNAAALGYAAEALSSIKELAVSSVECTKKPNGVIAVSVKLLSGQNSYALEVNI
ncbi:MAG TPA: hypothetical protein DCP97_00445 [Ruminococcaceae bacterium]|nr:hypothetical protein [Oscillospiraceae bacterium]